MSGDESSVMEGASALATCAVTDAVRALRTREEGNEELKARLQKMKVKDVKKVCSTLKVTISTAGKHALIERLVTYSEVGLLESGEYCPAMALKAMSYVTEEVQDKLSQLPKFSAVPEEKWGKGLRVLERLTYMDVYVYLVERKSSTLSGRQEANFKSLKGYSYYSSGWVENVYVCRIDESLLYFRGLVYQSYPSPSKEPYPVYACVGSTGNIFSAACKCVAGLGESCSHVAALLFLVEAASKSRQARLPDDVTCTDKTMSWHRPPKNYAEKLTKAVEVSEIVLQKATYGKLPMKAAGAGIAQYKPRSEADQDLNPVGLTKLLDAVSVSCPTSGLLHFHEHQSLHTTTPPVHHPLDEQVKKLVVPATASPCS